MTNVSKTLTGSSTSGKPWVTYPYGSRPSWDQVWMEVADTIAKRSLCSRAQVGCVVVDENQSVLAVTYNGPPPGFYVEGFCQNWCDRSKTGDTTSYDNCPSNHAEMNALARMAPPSSGFTAYINRMCCFTCAKGLAAAGASRVVCKTTNYDAHLDSAATVSYLQKCKVQIDFMED